ncbi:MAG: putative protein PaaI, possibly involved in aromatic compounds catabolism, partial [uncultured Ramlibacter sp.]
EQEPAGRRGRIRARVHRGAARHLRGQDRLQPGARPEDHQRAARTRDRPHRHATRTGRPLRLQPLARRRDQRRARRHGRAGGDGRHRRPPHGRDAVRAPAPLRQAGHHRPAHRLPAPGHRRALRAARRGASAGLARGLHPDGVPRARRQAAVHRLGRVHRLL